METTLQRERGSSIPWVDAAMAQQTGTSTVAAMSDTASQSAYQPSQVSAYSGHPSMSSQPQLIPYTGQHVASSVQSQMSPYHGQQAIAQAVQQQQTIPYAVAPQMATQQPLVASYAGTQQAHLSLPQAQPMNQAAMQPIGYGAAQYGSQWQHGQAAIQSLASGLYQPSSHAFMSPALQCVDPLAQTNIFGNTGVPYETASVRAASPVQIPTGSFRGDRSNVTSMPEGESAAYPQRKNRKLLDFPKARS